MSNATSPRYAFEYEGNPTTNAAICKCIAEQHHPLTVHAEHVLVIMLIEPTESESKASVDRFCDTLEALAHAAKAGETERFTAAPRFAPAKRLDETRAARQPVLRWTPAASEA